MCACTCQSAINPRASHRQVLLRPLPQACLKKLQRKDERSGGLLFARPPAPAPLSPAHGSSREPLLLEFRSFARESPQPSHRLLAVVQQQPFRSRLLDALGVPPHFSPVHYATVTLLRLAPAAPITLDIIHKPRNFQGMVETMTSTKRPTPRLSSPFHPTRACVPVDVGQQQSPYRDQRSRLPGYRMHSPGGRRKSPR